MSFYFFFTIIEKKWLVAKWFSKLLYNFLYFSSPTLVFNLVSCLKKWEMKNKFPINSIKTVWKWHVYVCSSHACVYIFKYMFAKTRSVFKTHARVWFLQAESGSHTQSVIFIRRMLISHEESDFDTLQCDFHTHECYFYTYESDFHIKSVIFTSKVRFTHTECDLETHECNFYTHESDFECDYDNHQLKLK
jgi:hypothetical protein